MPYKIHLSHIRRPAHDEGAVETTAVQVSLMLLRKRTMSSWQVCLKMGPTCMHQQSHLMQSSRLPKLHPQALPSSGEVKAGELTWRWDADA